MPQAKGFTSIGAGATTNVMSGQLFERVGGRGAAVKLYACAQTGNNGECDASLIAGSDVVCMNAALRAGTDGPIVPDDHIASGIAVGGDPLVVNIRNTTAAAIVVGWILDVTNV